MKSGRCPNTENCYSRSKPYLMSPRKKVLFKDLLWGAFHFPSFLYPTLLSCRQTSQRLSTKD
ncbi:hypothetical protein F2Z85_15585 [Bacteroides fragilis]|uniref:Uncharacterized protein n=1 Tax=Bacteroides fragilis TaxID=817 RepID=A0A642HH50_BACFG|nr:hypothetical protein F3B20_19815 [Bacteroides fragilis]KAA4797663.1 hypothetical protein F3B17_16985 [Bacteroides fragilis]KAA4801058.1 hypothetical protein F2045_15405 [Bacteroides fragilis]KAA4801428.1 hypothetical protein F2048_19550 [Bacteroides fragilis]KAA4810256.1 hypothetical protein F2050_17640 [Bacteroides fragilis]